MRQTENQDMKTTALGEYWAPYLVIKVSLIVVLQQKPITALSFISTVFTVGGVTSLAHFIVIL